MDPLSITTSVITLLGAASNVYNFLQSIRHADRGLQSLLREVSTLNGYLRSIDKALDDCRGSPYALSHIDPALWKESKIALSDCQGTIDELGLVFKEPKRPSRSNTLFRRARVAAELRSRAGDIASFREKISMSNLSLQTLLQVINVSLSLRSNESQDNILRDLKELKDALKKSSQAATVSYSTLFLNEQDISLVHHLKGLIRAAHDFHTSASVTASTVAGTQPPLTDFGDDDARSGISPRLPSMKRQQIETYLSENQRVARSNTSASSTENSEIISLGSPKNDEVVLEARDIDSNHTFSTIFTSGFSKIAQRALQQLDLGKAEGLLREALKWYSSSGSNDIHHRQRLQTQLALCSLLQGNSQEAQVLILDLVDCSTEQDAVAHQLLYALALLQLHELDFEGARENSKRLWAALQRMPHCTVLESNDAMRVLATSYQESGDGLLADAIEAELPGLRLSEPMPKMVDFLVDCEELLVGIFGLQDCPEISRSLSVVHKIHNLPIAKNPSSLQMREQQLQYVCSPISESPSGDADDDLSMKADPDFINDQQKAKKRSWSNLRALFRPRSMDLYPLNTGAQDSTFKLRKMVKISHVAPMSPQAPSPDRNVSVSSIQNPIKSKRNSLTKRGPETHNNHDSESNSRTMEWIAGQADSTSKDITITTTKTECQDIQEQKQQLRRQFSFQEGIADRLSEKPPTTSLATCYEMPNNAIFELMDTSPCVEPSALAPEPYANGRQRNKSKRKRLYKISKLDLFDNSSSSLCLSNGSILIPDIDFHRGLFEQPGEYQDGMATTTATSLEMENDIYNLLGYNGLYREGTEQNPTKLDRRPSLAGGDLLGQLDSSSGSDSDFFSDFDQVTRSTRQTSFDSSFMSAGEADQDSDIGEGSTLQSITRAKSQQATDESRSQASAKAMGHHGQVIEPEESLDPLRTRTLSCETSDDMAEPRSLKPHARSRREFGPAVARLCRYKSPRKTVFRKRLPISAAAGLRKLFHSENHWDSFDFGFNKALYTGPDAVVGPFTDLSPEEQDICKFAPSDIPTSSSEIPSDTLKSVKLHSRPNGSTEAALVVKKREPLVDTNKPPAYDNKGQLRNRNSSLTRTQIDEFFEVSQENIPFPAS
ncbi:hypothetical protein E0Z10_g1756 [Xylaria hypoxylon]|uniref:Fungal N-terminal domain-containing protein n=1 Tax=Xylaria hypoxylon TaxID=37992 RepID=A0A4Z0YSM4_9PEZI|nr:hypothetical protein E0Z10_g1756 [Xylaria hypoxylon]